MPYFFRPDLDAKLKERLASGDYDSEDDVLREASEALKLQDELARFRRSVAESREQAARGEAKSLDVDAVMQRVETRLSKTS